MTRSSNETALSHAIVKALTDLGFEVNRVNAGLARPMRGNGMIHLANPDTPDLLVVCPYLWIESKDLATLTPGQKRWHEWARRCNVPRIVARDVAGPVKEAMRLRRLLPYWERLVRE